VNKASKPDSDDDLRPEYDFSDLKGGVRGKYVGRDQAMTRHQLMAEPKSVVLAAYSAANRGQYAKANSFLSPAFLKGLARPIKLLAATDKRLRRALHKLKGRKGEAVARYRESLRTHVRSNRRVLRLDLASPRSLAQNWRCATHGRSVVRIDPTRQVIRGARARVYFKLTLRDGTIVRDSEPLIRSRGEWLLGL
jgi:hypothetical protein